jgi:hypothetical protein
MLTRLHLAVICAALMFWDEEMSPHDPDLFAAYFPEPIGTGEWITPAVRFLRDELPLCQLRYARCSSSGTELAAGSLFDSLEAAQIAGPEPSVSIATLLVFPTKA